MESHFREWDTIYSSTETDEAIGNVTYNSLLIIFTGNNRTEQTIHEWHMSKISEIQNTFYPTGEEVQIFPPFLI
jgi:hypothetical protein